MKIKKNDTVIVITGKDKGKTGKVIRTIQKHNKLVVEKVNMVTKHVKKRGTQAGEKIKFEKQIDASNVMILDPKTNKPTRIGYKILKDGTKERYAKASDSPLP